MTKVTASKPLLILLYGFPGSGKTHFARQLTEHFACAHVQSDRIRYELFENPTYSQQENEIIMQLMDYMTEEFLNAGISVIYDENASRLRQRQELRNMARRKKVEPVLIWLQTDADSAYSRVENRDRRKTDDKYAPSYNPQTFKDVIRRIKNPKNEDYIVISGKHNFSTQKNAVFKRLMELGLVTSTEKSIAKPGMVNLIPHRGRVDMTRRNIIIR